MEYYTGFPGYYSHSPLVYLEDNTTLYQFQLHATNLQSARLYGYRFRAESWLGNFYGNELLFTTDNKDSVFQTLPATNVADTTATLHGFAQMIGLQIYAGFAYGTTPALGNYVQADTILNSLVHHPSFKLNGLQPNTTYYYSLRGGFQYSNATYVYGDTLQFTTAPTGVGAELKETGNVIVYPNPTGSAIYLLSDKPTDLALLKIYDVEGRELLSRNATASNRIDVSYFSPGVYFVQTFNQAGNKTGLTRFMKQ